MLVAKDNVASIEASAAVIEGVSRSRNVLLNNDTKTYDWDSGYTCHQLGSGAIVVQLAQPYIIDSLRYVLISSPRFIVYINGLFTFLRLSLILDRQTFFSYSLLLWDCDDRTYSYYIEVSNDRHHWELVCDHRNDECR